VGAGFDGHSACDGRLEEVTAPRSIS
jgi:hypothetical protein